MMSDSEELSGNILLDNLTRIILEVKIDYKLKKEENAWVTFRQTVCLKMIQADS